MDTPLYLLARAAVALVQRLPLTAAARLGRWGGAVAWWLDVRHRQAALANLSLAFGRSHSPTLLRTLARENLRRIGENFACAIKTASMDPAAVRERFEVVGAQRFPAPTAGAHPANVVVAIGHFGNFELYARAAADAPGYAFATTYRALRQPALNRVLQGLREQSGCRFFERRTDAEALKAAMNRGGIMLGLLSDQHGGHKGVWGPFLGQVCSTTPAPAVFALRYHARLFCAFCYRVGLARWRIEVGEEILTHAAGSARSVEAITADINRAFEAAVLRDPANWFWVHRRWKPRGREAAPAPGE